MANYSPIPSIRDLVPFLNKSIEEINEEQWQSVAERLKKLQSPDPEVSIIVICRNEERYIFGCLASISQMSTDKRIEVIVVNNASSDRTQEILERLGVNCAFEEKEGWAEARQAGVNLSKTDVILSADGDNLYPPTWVDAITEPLFKDETVIITCGQYCFYTYDNKYPPFMTIYQNFRLINSLLRHPKRPHLNCLGGNMALRKSVLEKVGGYEMGIGRGEDGGLAFLMQRYGKIVYMRKKASYSYSSLRNIVTEGTLWDAFVQRIKTHTARLYSYLKSQKG
jgi:glycosyltransferase involved in cell wall biosynthesis